MSAADPLQRISEAAATVIDVDAGVAAITGRSSGNIVRFNPREAVVANSLAYLAKEATRRDGVGENFDVTLVLRAEASTAATANALVEAAIAALTVAALEANGADAVVLDWTFTNPSDADGDQPPTNPAIVAAEADLSIWLTL